MKLCYVTLMGNNKILYVKEDRFGQREQQTFGRKPLGSDGQLRGTARTLLPS